MTDPKQPSQSEGQVAREATQAMKGIAQDAAHPFFDDKHPGHQAAVAEMARLGEIARGKPSMQPGGAPAPTKQAGRTYDPYSGTFTPPELPPNLPPLPAGQEYDATMVHEYQQAAADLGVPEAEGREFLAYIIGWQPHKDDAAFDQAMASTVATLKQEWGPEYDRRMEDARRTYQRLPLAFQIALDDSGLANDPHVIRKFAALGEPMGKAQEEIDRILYDKSYPLHEAYFNPRHREHEKALQRMRRLHEAAHGTRPVVETVPKVGWRE